MNLIVGDSHSINITCENSVHLLCSAGSAKGLNNPHSVSQYNKVIIEKVKNNPYEFLIFNFGGVDVDFSFIHKFLDTPSINYHDFNLEVIHHYLQFITDHFSDKKVIILSVGLPTLDDEHLKEGLLNGHINYLENYDVTSLKEKLANAHLPDIYWRTAITRHFNEALSIRIPQLVNHNLKFLDVTTFTYDNDLKRIKNEFFSRSDHHNEQRRVFYTDLINDCMITF
jgi:hypothetical protein